MRILVATLITFYTLGNWSPVSASNMKQIDSFNVNLSGAVRTQGITIVDLDKNGKKEIIAAVGEQLAVINYDGTIKTGFPVVLKEEKDKRKQRMFAAPTACDLNGDGLQEIIIGTNSGHLYAVTFQGKLVSGFPVDVGEKIKQTALCADFNGNRQQDIIVPTVDGKLHWIYANGKINKSFKADVGSGIESSVAFGKVTGDKWELVVGGGDAYTHVINTKGHDSKSFSFKADFRISGIPALGDINDDGVNEIVFGNTDFKIYAVNKRGKVLDGFPIKTDYRIYASPALADMDGDQILDVVIPSGDGNLYCFDGKGKPLWKRWPKVGRGTQASPVIADLDYDGKPEVVQVGGDGKLHVFTHKGKNYTKPIPIAPKLVTTPAIADIDGDGSFEIVVLDFDGRMSAFTITKKGSFPNPLMHWPTFGHDNAHTSRYYPNAARFKDILIAPAKASTKDDLLVSYTYFDLDGDPERDTQIRWYVDGKHNKKFDNQRKILAKDTQKHQTWYYTLQEGENFKQHKSDSKASVIFTSAKQTITNSLASAPVIAISPANPKTTDALKIVFKKHSEDYDSDKLIYRYSWLKNRKPIKLGKVRDAIGPKKTRKNEKWTVIVTPFDGENEGDSGFADVVIQNTVPGKPTFTFKPKHPKVTDTIGLQLLTAPTDPDNDPITYSYQWQVNDKPYYVPKAQDALAGSSLHKADKIAVTIVAHDDEDAGGAIRLQTTIENSIPPQPHISIWPKNPTTSDALHVLLEQPVIDPDNDSIQYKLQWLLNGKPIEKLPHLAWLIPAHLTKKRQTWSVQVQPFDGQQAGMVAKSSITIGNHPPVAPQITLTEYFPTTVQDVTVTIVQAAQDPDNDPITLSYEWSTNNQVVQKGPSATLPAAKTKKNQTWQVKVTPHDGTVSGKPITLNFTTINTQPQSPVVSLSDTTPRSNESVSVKIDKAAMDVDGDAITYRYHWFRNGTEMTTWQPKKSQLMANEIHKGEHWKLVVYPYDGEVQGSPAYARLVVKNTEPEAPHIAVKPLNPTTTDDLTCSITQQQVDLDGDHIDYYYHWFKNGKEVLWNINQQILPAKSTKKNEKWYCQVEVFDGEEYGKLVTAKSVDIANSKPSKPIVAIEPQNPKTTDDLHCVLKQDSIDADNDRLQYIYSWTKNRKPFKHRSDNPAIISSKLTQKGQLWECNVKVVDDQNARVQAAMTASVTNVEPGPVHIALVPDSPAPGQTLQCTIKQESVDDDGDKIQYRFYWYKSNVQQAFAVTSRSIPGRLVKANDMWSCRVEPFDGKAKGPLAQSDQVLVRASW